MDPIIIIIIEFCAFFGVEL